MAKPDSRDELEKRGLCPFTFGRPGDRVFSRNRGWGVIHRISYYPPLMGLIAAFDSGDFVAHTLSGYEERTRKNPEWADSQELFWDEECTTAPMMPDHVAARNGVHIEATGVGLGG